MRAAMMGLVLLVLVGCGQGFKDDAEELRYLRSLSNPSVSQFQRKEELEKAEAKARAKRRAQAREDALNAAQEALAKVQKLEREGKLTDEAVDAAVRVLIRANDYAESSIYEDVSKELDRLRKVAREKSAP